MDSITHLFVGGAIAALAAPIGRRRAALVIGAIAGSLPDVDNLWLAFADPVSRFVEHRSATHSLLLLPVYAVVCWALLRALWRPSREASFRWFLAVFLALLSHVLTDALTVYGTRLFWPIDPAPVMGSNLFIIDPLFTLPLLFGCVVAWFVKRETKAKAWLALTTALATAYVGWTFVAKQQLEAAVDAHFAAQREALEVLTTPTPFNTLIWRVLVPTSDGGYFEGYYSFLRGGPLKLDHYPGSRDVPAADDALPELARLREFTRGYYRIDRRGGEYVFVDLRMGGEPDYLFKFAFAKAEGDKAVPIDPPTQVYPEAGSITKMWRRFKPMLLEGKATPAVG